ncbi:type II secretion system protein GspH [Acinetobacter sp. ANC 4558]|uniref:prepilin-type N-terminal cleavage/methylation domain-containing protein n=1 Tax=Acinetobacter sp. ANC 4558 TaxID=1977876 RepID=UPI000A35A9B9|nr:prepilin-type N-terminal cleavage/methylation domain-containing protein [Acinetobacter sp. ANC 4558]OTG86087.1 type II secretion system protein GspH [Acinetobacter sp. ANC 4558]
MKQSSQDGFTLVELMVVIVIVAIIASLILVNFSGIDHRKVMQAREILMIDLQRIARESQDQSKILALSLKPSIESNTYQYEVLEYQPQGDVQATGLTNLDSRWTKYSGFNARELPKNVLIQIKSTQFDFTNAKNTELLNERAPKLIWLGNGEIKPAIVQFYYDQQPVGAEIQIDYLGKIHEN